MATVIRLRREGALNNPFYRVIVADKRSPRDGKFLEILGHYAPRSKDKQFVLKSDRIQHWISKGAQTSETVAGLIKRKAKVEKTAAASA